MARLLTAGAESNAPIGSAVLEGFVGVNATTIQSSTVRSGRFAYKMDTGAGGAIAYIQSAATEGMGFSANLDTTYFVRAYYQFSNVPSSVPLPIMGWATLGLSVRLRTDGKIGLYTGSSDTAGTLQGFSTEAVTAGDGKWHRIELKVKISSGSGDDDAELYLNGVLVVTMTSATIGTTAPTNVNLGWSDTGGGTLPANFVMYVDDIAINDNTDSFQNSYPGEGRVALLLPESDNARDTLWTSGSGATGGQAVMVIPGFNLTDPLPDTASTTSASSFSLTLAGSVHPSTLIFVSVINTRTAGTPNTPTVSGLGLTWTQVNTVAFNTIATPTQRVTLFYAVTNSPLLGGTVTMDFGGQSQDRVRHCANAFYGCNTAAPIVQSATNSTDSATSLTVTLSTFADVNNAPFGAFANSDTSNPNAGSGFNRSKAGSNSSPNMAASNEARITEDTTIDMTSGSGGAVAWGGIAVEVDAGLQMFHAVSNLPPVGHATENDGTQIEHAGNSGGSTDRYDANMSTYASKGIGPYDKISVVSATVCHAEDVSTGTKLLKHQILSNPVGTATSNYNVAPTTGALSTWSTNWWFTKVVDYNVAVAVNTPPVMRVIRPETASRVASVCFMGIYVEYVEMGADTLRVNQAVKRAALF